MKIYKSGVIITRVNFIYKLEISMRQYKGAFKDEPDELIARTFEILRSADAEPEDDYFRSESKNINNLRSEALDLVFKNFDIDSFWKFINDPGISFDGGYFLSKIRSGITYFQAFHREIPLLQAAVTSVYEIAKTIEIYQEERFCNEISLYCKIAKLEDREKNLLLSLARGCEEP